MFLQVSVILFTWVVVSQHALQVSRPTPRLGRRLRGLQAHSQEEKLGGSGLGGLQAHTWVWGGLQANTRGGIPACSEADTPPADIYCWRQYASTRMQSCFRCNFRLSVVVLWCSSIILTMKYWSLLSLSFPFVVLGDEFGVDVLLFLFSGVLDLLLDSSTLKSMNKVLSWNCVIKSQIKDYRDKSTLERIKWLKFRHVIYRLFSCCGVPWEKNGCNLFTFFSERKENTRHS